MIYNNRFIKWINLSAIFFFFLNSCTTNIYKKQNNCETAWGLLGGSIWLFVFFWLNQPELNTKYVIFSISGFFLFALIDWFSFYIYLFIFYSFFSSLNDHFYCLLLKRNKNVLCDKLRCVYIVAINYFEVFIGWTMRAFRIAVSFNVAGTVTSKFNFRISKILNKINWNFFTSCKCMWRLFIKNHQKFDRIDFDSTLQMRFFNKNIHTK